MSGGRWKTNLDDWIGRARAVGVRAELERRGLWTKALIGDRGAPCPGCGGRDRFAVNVRKDVWVCRASSSGGDAIALAQHIDGSDFLAACETVLGEPRPDGRALSDAEKRDFAARAERMRREEERRRTDAAASQARFRERERKSAHEIWSKALPLAGTQAEAYLALRGLVAPPGARLRYEPEAPLWDRPPEHGGRVLHRGPAMVAAIEGPDGRFAGVHRTWIDLSQPGGKALVADPKTGELAPAKKVRGSVRGGSILLRPACLHVGFPGDWFAPTRLFLGEGNETTLAVFCALEAAGSTLLERAEFRAAVSLGNLAGRAAGRVRHPTLTRPDKNGVARPVFVPSAEPAEDDGDPVIPVPASVRELWLLGDGDSEPVFTRLALERAARRFMRARPEFEAVRLAMAKPGRDFNDMWRAA
ncbi:DNA primase [Methylocella sp.]|uniref:DUF7146 domain-containing protein n=1 Tax=Methylocella sp. TaxID=1978226 RepID=UPI0035AE3CC3